MRHSDWRTRVVLGIAALLVVTGCTAPAAAPAPSGSATARPSGALVTAQPSSAGGLTSDGKILVRWFVGLGTGGDPEQLRAESAAGAQGHAPGGPCTKADIKPAP